MLVYLSDFMFFKNKFPFVKFVKQKLLQLLFNFVVSFTYEV